jgi:hypothetical protein
MILEGMAQAGGVLALKSAGLSNEELKKKVIYFMSIDKAKFRNPVKPGDKLEYRINVIKLRKNLIVLDGKAYVEDVLKESVRFGFITKAFSNYPMGRMLRHGFKKRIPDQLYDDLLWLNDGINIHVKHDYAAPDLFPEGEPLDSHLFDLDEALAVYLIARRLVVELETIYGNIS